jgi:rare lipoprotein A (peptidoglycan hydrolase)
MTPRPVRVLAVLAFAVTATAPAASAQTPPTGGTQYAPSSSTVSATNGEVAIVTRVDALLRRTTRFRGSVAAAYAGRTVSIERFDPLLASWAPVATATVAPDGGYLARWRADVLGVLRIRAVVQSPGQASAASASPEVGVTVYRQALATWYGPGFYGRRTACGLKMSHALLGVAHKRLACGTPVAISYKGRRVTVPVVDRGPFARGVSYDLTFATAQALGFAVTDRVGAVPVGPAPPPATG